MMPGNTGNATIRYVYLLVFVHDKLLQIFLYCGGPKMG